MRFLGRVRFLGRSPLTIVELIIAIGAIVGGLYVMSPILAYSTAVNGASPLIQILGHPVAILIYGGMYVASGATSVYGILSRNTALRSIGLFCQTLCRTYGLIGTFLIQGFLPFTWWSSSIVIFISIIVYIWLRGLIVRGLTE